MPDATGRVLVMQVTTTGAISGQVNYQVFPLGVGADQVQVSVEFDGAGTFDIDSDGRITREEFVSALTRKCAKDGGAHSLTEDQANALFDEADVDRSNCIDAEEVNKMRRRTSTTHLILFRPFYFSR